MAFRQVTVFGGSGFIGRYVVQRIARTGARVAVAVRDTEGAQFVRMFGHVGQVLPVPCDVTRSDTIAPALQGSDAAVNLVGILYQQGRQRFDEVHRKAAGGIAEAARAAGLKRLVHLSAIGADPRAGSAYARSKGLGEEAVRTAFSGATILRPSVVFGPEDDFFNRFARLARIAPALPLFGGGRTKFQPVYVADVADAVAAALADKASRGRTYELGGPAVLTFEEVLRLILAETGRKRWFVRLPFWVADVIGTVAPLLPRLPGTAPFLTRDQAVQLRGDNIVAAGSAGLEDLGVAPTALELVLPDYLDKYARQQRRTRPVRVL
ncbi:MAG TPA: complex I NDUFA9 subunit family protein [Alphaproteobacteria bacterium]|nr:complex I NDUFA9 subunit family protein [Alphaproteobacteria bacterium]